MHLLHSSQSRGAWTRSLRLGAGRKRQPRCCARFPARRRARGWMEAAGPAAVVRRRLPLAAADAGLAAPGASHGWAGVTAARKVVPWNRLEVDPFEDQFGSNLRRMKRYFKIGLLAAS